MEEEYGNIKGIQMRIKEIRGELEWAENTNDDLIIRKTYLGKNQLFA